MSIGLRDVCYACIL